MPKTPDLSIIVPCFDEEASLPLLKGELDKLVAAMKGKSLEFIFVDDGSEDGTAGILGALGKADKRYRWISFSRNFGKEAALLAGLEAARGKFVAVIDADLQDPPSMVPELYAAVAGGEYDCAATRRVTRKGEPMIRSFFARRFYRIMAGISDAHIVDGARDFRVMSRRMVDSILSLKEYNRFSKGIFSWVGYKTKWFEYQNVERAAGTTKWSFWKLVAYSLEGIVAFSTAPLVIASVAGIILCILALAMIVFLVARTLIWGDPVAGYPSLMSAVLFIGGIQLFAIGILGQYLAKTYLETKKRPIYLVKEKSE